jgi:hypothetical protein
LNKSTGEAVWCRGDVGGQAPFVLTPRGWEGMLVVKSAIEAIWCSGDVGCPAPSALTPQDGEKRSTRGICHRELGPAALPKERCNISPKKETGSQRESPAALCVWHTRLIYVLARVSVYTG